ncbi:MAG: methyltransferase domain-containing protein [Actinomycetia bacterium]|nr:methyltransferase domain-containing protein [Actinomycetes bacterium]
MNEDTTTQSAGARQFGGSAPSESPVDRDELRAEVQAKYAAVAATPDEEFHFHTGRTIAQRCRYDMAAVDALPSSAVESFAGVANPFELRDLVPGERVVDLGAGAGFDSFVAALAVGSAGHVVGVDMTEEMIAKSRSTAATLETDNVEFREGFLEDLPIEDGWADVVIANGVINLCPDKIAAFTEAWRVLKAGGVIQFADIANGLPVPDEAQRHIDLWTG